MSEVEQDDWSMEFDAEHVHFGQDGLGDFDWSNNADDAPASLALMATKSEVPYCSKCSKSYKQLLENYQTERDNFQKARSEILGYQMSLESLEVILKTREKNEYAWGDKYEQMEYDLKIRDLKLEEKQKELDQALKERDDFKVCGLNLVVVKEIDNSSGNTIRQESLYPNFQKAKDSMHKTIHPTRYYHNQPRANVSFTGIDELAIRNKGNPEEDLKRLTIIEQWKAHSGVPSRAKASILQGTAQHPKGVRKAQEAKHFSSQNRIHKLKPNSKTGQKGKAIGQDITNFRIFNATDAVDLLLHLRLKRKSDETQQGHSIIDNRSRSFKSNPSNSKEKPEEQFKDD
ncbi:hypothetical protein Tco_0779926 [Tanacetum coccineum]